MSIDNRIIRRKSAVNLIDNHKRTLTYMLKRRGIILEDCYKDEEGLLVYLFKTPEDLLMYTFHFRAR